LSVTALLFFVINVTKAFSGGNKSRNIRAVFGATGAYMVNFPEPVTEFSLMVQGLHSDAMTILLFVVGFVTYMLCIIIRKFKRTYLHYRASHIKSKSIIYLEFL